MMKIENSYPMPLSRVNGGLVQPVAGQIILAILASMTGQLGYLVAAGIIGHWAAVAFIAIRKRNALTKRDVIWVRYGYLIFGGGAFVAVLVGAMVCNLVSRIR
jgi:hypothetical protein